MLECLLSAALDAIRQPFKYQVLVKNQALCLDGSELMTTIEFTFSDEYRGSGGCLLRALKFLPLALLIIINLLSVSHLFLLT